jgi:hypothetical protein
MRYFRWLFILVSTVSCLTAQTLKTRPPTPAPSPVQQKSDPMIPLTVEAGTPLNVMLAEELRIQNAGQPIHGKTTEPIYAFDKLLVPQRCQR